MTPLPRLAAGASALALIAGVTACSPGASTDDRDLSLTVAALPHELNYSWDPVNGDALVYFLPGSQPVYEPLLVLNVETLEYEPWLAEEYEISDDRHTMTVTLRDGISFTDGEPLTSEAVKKNLDLLLPSPNYAGTEFAAYDTAITVIDELTFEITTSTGISTRFLNALTYMAIVSPVALDDPETLAGNPVGTGPYLLDEQVADVSQSFVRNPDYWNPDAYPFDELEFVIYEDNIAAANALKSGQVDATHLDISLVADVESAGFTIHTGGGSVTTLVWLDRDAVVQPALADVRVRQAISYALDREAINESLNLGYGVVSSQPFVEGQAEYIEGGDERFPYDLDKARDLMAEAGYEDGFDITMPTWPGYADFEPIVQQTLADIGIRVTFESFPDNAGIIEAVVSGQYPLIIQTMTDVFWVSYLSDGGYMAKFGPSPEPVGGIIDVIENGTPEESAAASQELGELLLEEGWYIPFSRRLDAWGTTPEVHLELGKVAGWPVQLSNFSVAD